LTWRLHRAVTDLLPQYADLRTAEKARITLRHLLTMSASLKWDEDIRYVLAAAAPSH
jgi:CubicO group peptidase (beta-lactamase class C family)